MLGTERVLTLFINFQLKKRFLMQCITLLPANPSCYWQLSVCVLFYLNDKCVNS